MRKRLTSFIEKKNNILYNAQYGFGANGST